MGGVWPLSVTRSMAKFTRREQWEEVESGEGSYSNVEILGLSEGRRSREEMETRLIMSGGEETLNDRHRNSLVMNGLDEDGVVREYEDVLKVVGFGLFQFLLMAINGLALSSEAFEILSVSYIVRVIRRHDEFGVTDTQNALLSSVMFIGMLFGSFVWGGLSDVSGRRFTLLTSMSVNGAFGLMSAFAPNFPTFVVFRFVSGIGVGGSLPVVGTYASEFVSNTYRGPFLSIQGVFWMVGQLLCGALAWIVIPQHSIDMLGLMTIHSWRLFIAISALPSVFSAILYYFMPESPRYLLETGKEKKALKALKLMYQINQFINANKGTPFPIKSIRLDIHTCGSPREQSSDSSFATQYQYKFKEVGRRVVELFRGPLLRSTQLLFVILFTLSLGYYGITLWYPSYVGLVNQQKLCHQTISPGEAVTYDLLHSLCGCTESVFDDITISDMELTDWTLKKAVFNNVHFSNVNFTRVELTSSVLSNCIFDRVNFKEVYLDELKWERLSLNHVQFDSVKICSSQLTVANGGFITMRNVLVGDRVVGMEQLNSSTFAVLAPSADVRCPSLSVVRDVNVECEIESSEDSKVYRDSFLIAASAAPGNVVSAFAVYYFRRNVWMAFVMLSSAMTMFLLLIEHSEVMVVAVLCLFTAVNAPAWTNTGLLITELYPTRLRSTAHGMHLLMGRLGAIIGTNLFGMFVYTSPSVPILLVTTLLLAGAATALLLPKTTRRTRLK